VLPNRRRERHVDQQANSGTDHRLDDPAASGSVRIDAEYEHRADRNLQEVRPQAQCLTDKDRCADQEAQRQCAGSELGREKHRHRDARHHADDPA
jgi:hypothetical protein